MKLNRNCKPTFSKILVRLIDCNVAKEEVSKNGIIIALNTALDIELQQQATSYGYVMDMGPYVGYRNGIDFREAPCKVGDKILFYKHAGTLIDEMNDGHWYRVIEDLDVQAAFPDEGVVI